MGFVRVTRKPLRQQSLKLELHRGDGDGIEELAQILAAQKLGQELSIERQRLRAPLSERRVAFIHELRDVREEKRRCKRRRALRVDGDHPHLTGADRTEESGQRRHVEVVAHAFAPGLGEDRKVGVLARHLQQVGAPHPLLPQGRSLAGPPAR